MPIADLDARLIDRHAWEAQFAQAILDSKAYPGAFGDIDTVLFMVVPPDQMLEFYRTYAAGVLPGYDYFEGRYFKVFKFLGHLSVILLFESGFQTFEERTTLNRLIHFGIVNGRQSADLAKESIEEVFILARGLSSMLHKFTSDAFIHYAKCKNK